MITLNLICKKMISLLKKTLICCFAFATMVGCAEKPVSEIPYIPEVDIPDDPNATRLLITSEGNYGSGNSSLALIRNNNITSPDAFKSVNNRTMGDVAQSLTEIGDNYYVALNNSRKIEVINKFEAGIIYGYIHFMKK